MNALAQHRRLENRISLRFSLRKFSAGLASFESRSLTSVLQPRR
ncbi:MAG: YSIRK-type signal peptide-containing protein [Rhizobiales bacterium]|nr:YSIRK-type signal peptide-containing protein [Hyphomicrobiales bacterium]